MSIGINFQWTSAAIFTAASHANAWQRPSLSLSLSLTWPFFRPARVELASGICLSSYRILGKHGGDSRMPYGRIGVSLTKDTERLSVQRDKGKVQEPPNQGTTTRQTFGYIREQRKLQGVICSFETCSVTRFALHRPRLTPLAAGLLSLSPPISTSVGQIFAIFGTKMFGRRRARFPR